MLKQTRARHRMSFDYLEGFLEVAKVKNFSRAASILYRTQPTLSQQIQRLEMSSAESCLTAISKR